MLDAAGTANVNPDSPREQQLANIDGGVAAGDEPVDLGEFGFGGGEVDVEPFGFAGPALAFGFGDAGEQVVADLLEPTLLGRVDAQEWAPNAGFSELKGRSSQSL